MAIGNAYAGGTVLPADNCRIGLFDYNDLATATTPIAVLAGVPKALTNDELGTFTNKATKPVGVNDVWLAGSDVFDWSDLNLGDMVDIRLDIEITTSTTNTDIDVALELGTGGNLYTIPFVTEMAIKAAGTEAINIYNGIYMGDLNTLDNGGVFKITASKDCDVQVNGWYCKVLIQDT